MIKQYEVRMKSYSKARQDLFVIKMLDNKQNGTYVEVDLRMKNGIPALGNDYGQYEVSLSWIRNRASNLLIHVKEFDALVGLQENIPNSRFFAINQMILF